jgi:hypothetical protein
MGHLISQRIKRNFEEFGKDARQAYKDATIPFKREHFFLEQEQSRAELRPTNRQ